jgi:hypothetical protein
MAYHLHVPRIELTVKGVLACYFQRAQIELSNVSVL